MSLAKVLSSQNQPKSFSVSERRRHVWDLFRRGIPVATIANSLGYSDDTIYEDLRYLKEKFREELQKATAVSHLTEHIQFLEELKNLSLQQVVLSDPNEIEVDSTTGKVIAKSPTRSDQNTVKFLDLVLRIERAIIDLKLDTGVISREPQKLQHSIDTLTTVKKEDKDEDRTVEQIKSDIETLLSRARKFSAQ
jgi:hypothetical protein